MNLASVTRRYAYRCHRRTDLEASPDTDALCWSAGNATRQWVTLATVTESSRHRLDSLIATLRAVVASKPAPMLPRPYDVPWAEETVVDDSDALLAGGPPCGARAQFSSTLSSGRGGVPGVPNFQLIVCGRARGHVGPHMSLSTRLCLRRHKHHVWRWSQEAPSALSERGR